MKRLFTLLLVFIVAFALIGCDDKNSLSIEDNEKAITLAVGDTREVSPTVTGEKKVIWESSDNEVATVSSSGIITAVEEGTATITVSLEGTEIKVTITVTVTRPAPTSVTITGAGTLVVGGTLQLTGSVVPAGALQTLTWTSGNTETATVNNSGLVTGVAAGEVKITATSSVSTVKAEVTVTVVIPDPTAVTITGPNEVVLGEEITLTATVAPELAAQGVVWSVDDEDLATITEAGVLTGVAAGEVVVKAVSSVKESIFGEYTVTVKLPVPTGVTITGPRTLKVEETGTYTATVAPSAANQAVVWSVDDEDIATISETGVLTAVEAGTVKVIATSVALGTVKAEYEVTVEEPDLEVELDLNGGYIPFTATDAFVQGEPSQVFNTKAGYNPTQAEYLDDEVGYKTHLFIQDSNYKIAPSVWQNRVFLNRNAKGFYEVGEVIKAGAGNANPVLSDYEYVIYAHEGYTAGYNFISDLKAGQLLTLGGFDISSVSEYNLDDIVIKVYSKSQGQSIEKLSFAEGEEVELPIIARNGAVFDGWYLDDEYTGEAVTVINEAATVYAKWAYDFSVVVVNNDEDVEDGETYYSSKVKAFFIKGITAFDTLAEALDAVEAGGKVYVEAGEYADNATVSKNGLSIIGLVGAVIKGRIEVNANIDGLTIQDLDFAGAANIELSVKGGIKNFVFKNNIVEDSTRHEATFINFKNDGTADNENFVFDGNQFLITDNGKSPRWIRGGNIKNLTITNNIFEGIKEVYVDGIRIEGTNEGNGAGIGVGGVVNITGNKFAKIGQRALWFRRISATEFNFTENTLIDNGDTTYGGGLQLEVLVAETVLEVNILENTFKDFASNFGVRIGTAATPTLGTVKINYNKFVDFVATPFVDAYEGVTNVDANMNYYTVLPTATEMPKLPAEAYAVAFDNLDDLEEAISQGKPQTVTYDSQGGTAVPSETVPGGKKATKPEDPTQKGYDFVGWYKDAAGTKVFNFDVDTIVEATTLYAKWSAVDYDLTYEYNGGKLSFANQQEMFTEFVTDFHTYTKSTDSLQVFMHGEGNTSGFAGTWASKSGDDYVYLNKLYDGARPDAPNADEGFFVSDPEYYLKWMPFFDMLQDFVKIVNKDQNFWVPEDTFVGLIRLPQFVKGVKPAANVSDATMAMMPAYTVAVLTYNIEVVTALPTPVKEGFVFAGWYDNVDLDGEVMDVIPKGLSGDLTLYAKWVDPEVVEGVVIVDENLAGLYYGQKIIIDDAVYQVGVNLFTNLVDAVDALVEGDVVVVLPGTYVGDFTLEVDNVTLIGPNHDVNPNTDNREEEAIIDGVITLGKEVANVSIKGFKFVDESQVLNVLGPVGTTEVVATNVDGFEFVYNIVESKLEDGNGFIYFVEAVSSYSRDLVISYNYFTVIAEDSALEYFVYLDNHAGLEVVGNVFENIPKTAFYVNDTTKGLAGETKVLENMFLNIGEDAFKVNWLSPLPGTTMGVLVADNLFDDVGGVAVYFGSMNNNDSLEALHILRNEFRNINAGVHLDRVHATANVLVNFNKFVDVPTTFYIKDAKTAGTPVTLDATKNAYLEDGAVITPDANKFVGSPDYSDPLVGVVGFNAYGQYEVSFNEYETNSDKLRAEFIKDWNAKFETTWTTLKATDFHASASTGAGGSATKDISNSNLYKFFHDEVYEEKWGWLLDYMATQGGIHPQRQLVALMGNGTSPDAANPETLFQLWDLMHLTFSFANFFNQATDNMGYAPIDFNVPSKYATLATFNDQILKNYELYAMINEGGTVVLPEPPKRVNYNFVGYKVGEDVYNAGDNVVVDEGMVFALVYQVVEYDVTFFDGEVELVEEATTYTHEAKKDLPTIEKEGYLFLGWYTNVELEGDPVTSIPAGATGDKVFYAGWEGLSYAPVEVTFELNGGTSAHYVQASRFNEVDWSGTTVIVKTSSQANWYNIALKETNTPNLYEVLGKGSGGYSHDDATLYIQYHDEITGIYKPVMSYVFENLAVGNLVLVKNIPATSGTSPIDIYFLLDDSSSIKEDMLLPEEFSICPLRVGYTFDGWYDNAAFDGEAVESYPGFAEDDNVTKITYYAKWEQDDLSVAFVRNQPVNSKVSVKGVVTAVAGINAFIQDATAGIYIYVGSGTDYVDDLVVGNEVLITGVIDNYNGQIQLKTILKVEVLKTEQGLPDPVVLGELDLDLLGEHQGKLLSMEGLRIKNIPTLGTSHVSIILTRDDVEIIFYIYSYVDGYEALKDIFAGALVGQMVDLVGVPIGFHNNAQLVPTAVDQLVLKAIDGEAIKIYVEEQLDPGEEAIIDLALADKVTVKEVEYTVEWVSNKPTVISNAGVVVRPAKNEDHVLVTLTASVKLGEDVIASIEYEVLVLNLNLAAFIDFGPTNKTGYAEGNLSFTNGDGVDYVLPKDRAQINTPTAQTPALILAAIKDKEVAYLEFDFTTLGVVNKIEFDYGSWNANAANNIRGTTDPVFGLQVYDETAEKWVTLASADSRVTLTNDVAVDYKHVSYDITAGTKFRLVVILTEATKTSNTDYAMKVDNVKIWVD